jgi:U6 snRNA phosphodiesterase
VTKSIRFRINFAGLDWVANFEKTRWFLVLRLGKHELDGLNKLLHLSNQVVEEYGQPALYTKLSTYPESSKKKKAPNNSWVDMEDVSDAFHISIAWTLTSPSHELLELTKTLGRDQMKELDRIEVKIEEIKSKVGNTVTNIPLPRTVSVRKGLFGV